MRQPTSAPLRTLAALVLGLALLSMPAATGAAEAQEADPQQQARVIKVEILGMSCPFCAYGAEQKLKKLDGVDELEVELDSGLATLTMEEDADIPNETLKKTVDDAGFEAAAIVRTFESEHEDWHPERILDREERPGTRSGR